MGVSVSAVVVVVYVCVLVVPFCAQGMILLSLPLKSSFHALV